MQKITKLFTIILVVLFSAGLLMAQDEPEFSYKMGGTVQAWTSMGEIHGADTNSLGWGLRRVRLRAYATLGDKMKGFVQMELTSPKLLDARIQYLVTKAFTVTAGRFIGAGVRAGGLTSHTVIDITERAYSAIKWGGATIGADYRDYGLDFAYNFGDVTANVTLHNGNGAANVLNRQTAVGPMNGSFAVSGMLKYQPAAIKGLEAGGYYGMGNAQINEYNSFNAYVYYEPKPIRVKAEVIGWTNVGAATDGSDLSRMGYYVFAGYGFAKNWEAVARYENYDHNTDVDDNEITLITLGATYSVFETKWTAGKLTGAYVLQQEAGTEIDNNVIQLVMQLVF
ncbi:MAG: hypothetical protein KDC88_10825 [Ignavibacteriae bacterium]|nr:hypothetical protein [Ignavibacteriota bacterium]MCB9209726.1 hypothetical protein [Ignavibacteriales bacterium]MCB9218882.1 hypothetical protein [Ignavibacteriales bacterium]